MTSITIALPNDLMHKLKETAARYNVAPEELVRASVEELLTSSEETFTDAIEYVIEKNKKLYERLAA